MMLTEAELIVKRVTDADPYWRSSGLTVCFFCGASAWTQTPKSPEHLSNCLWVKAGAYVKQQIALAEAETGARDDAPCGCRWPKEVQAYFHFNQSEGEYRWRKFDPAKDAERFVGSHADRHPATR